MNDASLKEKIRLMGEGGKKLGAILIKLLDLANPGVRLLEIDALADRLITDAGGSASFKTVKGYQWTTCLCVNEVVVHGIPTDYSLQEGDVLTIDIGLLYKGFHTDTAWTKIVKSQKQDKQYEKERFLRIGEETLWKAIDEAHLGNRIGHISKAIQTGIESAGYSVMRTLVGHGVGKLLHEAPQIPGFVRGPIENTPLLQEGMTLAIEVIYAQGKPDVEYAGDDGWSISTKDKSLSAVFEHTVVIASRDPIVLTKPEN